MVGRGGQVEFHPFAVQVGAGQGHVIFPADQATHVAQRCAEHGNGAAVAFAPHQPFRPGRLDLAVLAKQLSLAVIIQQRAIQRAAAELRVALHYTHRQMDAVLARDCAQSLRLPRGHGDGATPVLRVGTPTPVLALAHHGAEAEPARVGRDVGFREQHQLCSGLRRPGGPPRDAVDGRGGLQHGRGGLHDGHGNDVPRNAVRRRIHGHGVPHLKLVGYPCSPVRLCSRDRPARVMAAVNVPGSASARQPHRRAGPSGWS